MARYPRAANVNTLRLSVLGRQPGFTAVVCHPCHGHRQLRKHFSVITAFSPLLGRQGSCTPQASEAETEGLALGPPIPSQSQPEFANGNPLGPTEAKVVIYHIELGAFCGVQGRKGQPLPVEGQEPDIMLEPRMAGRILRWPPRFRPLVDTPCVTPFS